MHRNVHSDKNLLYRTTAKTAKLDSHLDFLQTCMAQSKLPKGLRLHLKPSVIGTPSSRFTTRWNAILNAASFQLIALILCRTQWLSDRLHAEKTELLDKIKSENEPDYFNKIMETHENQLLRLQNDLKQRKENKLERLKHVYKPEKQNKKTLQEENKAHTRRRCRRFTRRQTSSTQTSSSTNVVVNLSSKDLTTQEESLLSKGLNFCPKPPNFDRGSLINDTKGFSRRLRLKCHFAKADDKFDNTCTPSSNESTTSHSGNEENIKPKFKNKSDWKPPKQLDALETFISNVESDIASFQPSKRTHENLTKGEKQAIRSLKNCDDIIIKPADKGSGVVVMDKDHYVSEAERQLNDTMFYQKLAHDPTEEFQEKVCTTLKKMLEAGQISEKNYDYLVVKNPKPGRFYLLPKIHKPGNPGRPIVSANGHPTEKISEFVDFHLRPHVVELPSYVQDTTDYLQKVESQDIPDETHLVSMDVTSLYTNIPHHDGIEACKEVWEQRVTKEPPTEILVELLTLILKSNNFEFNGDHYLQIQGTAMGTKMAPSYANIFMGRLENQLLASVSLKPSMWLRFIDDIDMHWCHSLAELQIFLSEANDFHPTIKFTSEISNDKHVFLDTVSSIENGKLTVDLYTKPTDKHQYLLPTSCHPKHCAKNIPYSLALRMRRICTQTPTFEHRAAELSKQLVTRGYDQNAVSASVQKARQQERQELLQYKEKQTNNDRVPYVLTYHPELPDVRNVVDKHWPTIESSRKLSKVFKDKPVIAYRRPKSLRDILVKAKIKTGKGSAQKGSSSPCNAPRCKTCPMMKPTSRFSSTLGAISSVKGKQTCKSKHAIYLMTCTVCNKKYVGETTQPINMRMNLHRSDWKLRRFDRSPVAEHFNQEHHSFGDIKLCVIESNKGWSEKDLMRRETYWIRRLNTLQPFGINKGD